MKTLIKNIFFNKRVAIILQKFFLKLDGLVYRMISILAIQANDGTHPKHGILGHKEWFVDHINAEWIVLDVGSNTGTMVELMAEKSEYVYGIEIEKDLHNKAITLKIRENTQYVLADATTFDYGTLRPIDCVTLSNVLEHIEHRTEFLTALSQQIQWKEKPYFLIRVPMLTRDWVSIYKKDLGMEYRLDMTHYTEYTDDQFEKEMSAAGLSIEFKEVRFGELYAICKTK